jgi:hypothetical protein
VFRDQSLQDEQQIALTRQFGDLEGYKTGGHIRPRAESRLGSGIADFSNLDKSKPRRAAIRPGLTGAFSKVGGDDSTQCQAVQH